MSIKKVVAVLALTGLVAGASAEGPRFGLALGPNLSGFMASGEESSSADGLGFGFIGGGIMDYKFAEEFGLRVEANFEYRVYGKDEIFTEMLVNIPIMFVYHVNTEAVRGFGALGVNVDIPFGTESNYTNWWSGKYFEKCAEDRAPVDVGLIVKLGYYITDNLGVDVGYTFNFTKMIDVTDEKNIQNAVDGGSLYYVNWNKWAAYTTNLRVFFLF